jgi:serine/threonine-protein kinase
MATVELAVRRQSDFARLYAVKRLRPHLAEEAEVREGFIAEAQVAGTIRHPNVVSVIDVGTDERGPFLVMDWVDGIPLHRFVPKALENGPLPIALGCRIVAQVARGLHAAHEFYTPGGDRIELVHRDVSPQNILVGYDGLVRVTDFGIAKALGRGRATTTGLLKGKVGYLAPEQLRFETLDRRADLFGIGVVLFELLSGARLYATAGADLESTAKRILREDPPSIGDTRRDAPPALEELLFSLLSKAREDRPATAKETAERLEAIAAEIELDEGPVNLEAFMEERFRDDRAGMRTRIADAIARIGSETTATTRITRPRSPRFFAIAGALVAGSLAIAATAWAISALGGSDPAEPRVVSTHAAAPMAPAIVQAPAVQAPAMTDPIEVVEDPVERPRARARTKRTTQMRSLPMQGEGGWN